jgi:DNA-binding protein YbaB
MFDKIFEAQQKAEEAKQRLSTIGVSAEVENGAIEIQATADKKIKSVNIKEEFFAEVNREELEELLTVVINKVLEKAENVSNAEMAAVTQQMMGGLGNLGNLFGK